MLSYVYPAIFKCSLAALQLTPLVLKIILAIQPGVS